MPRRTWKLTSCTAFSPPKFFDMPRTSRTMSAPSLAGVNFRGSTAISSIGWVSRRVAVSPFFRAEPIQSRTFQNIPSGASVISTTIATP